MELDGPAPACRLDFAMCSVSLRVAPSGGAGDAGDVSAARDQAKETLDEELRRMGSAGSGRSAGSASSTGSQRSVASAGSQPRDEKVPSDPSSPGTYRACQIWFSQHSFTLPRGCSEDKICPYIFGQKHRSRCC